MKHIDRLKILYGTVASEGNLQVSAIVPKQSPNKVTQVITSFSELCRFIKTNQSKELYWLGNLDHKRLERGKDGDIDTKSYVVFDIDIVKHNPDVFNGDDTSTMLEAIGMDITTIKAFGDLSAVVVSGGGIHLYYRLSNPIKIDVASQKHWKVVYEGVVKEFQAALDSVFEGIIKIEVDASCSNLARIMRMPYSTNFKYDPPVQAQIVYANECSSDLFENIEDKATRLLLTNQPRKELRIIDPSENKLSLGYMNSAKYDEDRKSMDLDIQVAKRVPITEIVGKYTTTPIFENAKYLTTSCIFHNENTPSLQLFKDTNRFKCFGCNKYGDTIDVVMLKESIGFPQAVNRILNY